MTENYERTREVIAKVLKTTVEQLPNEASLGDFDNWDSLAQLIILSSLEQEFGISIEPEMAVDLTSVAKLCEYVKLQGEA
jgi:acyl carrier protein